jgi:hypothetical protein
MWSQIVIDGIEIIAALIFNQPILGRESQAHDVQR